MNYINEAFKENYNNAMTEGNERAVKALTKAILVIERDDYTFDGEKLIFTSPYSGKQRIVTQYGCHRSCDCHGGSNAYHFQMFWVLRKAWLRSRSAIQDQSILSLANRVGRYERMVEDMDNSPYLKTGTGKKPEAFGGISNAI